MKKTLVLGASPNSSRVSFDAVLRLQRAGHPVVAIGARPGEILGTPIITGQPPIKDIHTVTLYLNAERQREYYDYILELKPQRLIFNPGTENPELSRLAREAGIATEIACTLVMLSVQAY